MAAFQDTRQQTEQKVMVHLLVRLSVIHLLRSGFGG